MQRGSGSSGASCFFPSYAITLNAAAALCRAERIGSIEAGKQADILIWDAEDLDYIFYRFGAELVQTVFKAGMRVHG